MFLGLKSVYFKFQHLKLSLAILAQNSETTEKLSYNHSYNKTILHNVSFNQESSSAINKLPVSWGFFLGSTVAYIAGH